MEEGDRCAPVGTRRVYSNIGIDVAVATACAATDANGWLSSQVNGALGFSVNFSGRASSGASGSLNELGALGRAWLRSQNLIPSTRDEFVDPFLANLAGVVPGFGRFDPCPWGLGVEIHGQKHHWMGSKFSSRAYGHFGQSGSLLLIDPDADVVVAALAGENFGPWAQSLWPLWTDELFNEFVA
jgi:CubicO group peptidase (beta-lactamase class C family)